MVQLLTAMPAASLKAEDGHTGHLSRGFAGGAVKAECPDPTVSALSKAALPGTYGHSLHFMACVRVLGTGSSSVSCLMWLRFTAAKLGNFQMHSRKTVRSARRETANRLNLAVIQSSLKLFSLYLLNICLVLLLLYHTTNLNLSLSDFKQHLECNYMPQDT